MCRGFPGRFKHRVSHPFYKIFSARMTKAGIKNIFNFVFTSSKVVKWNWCQRLRWRDAKMGLKVANMEGRVNPTILRG